MRLPTIKTRAKRSLEETLEMALAETTLSLRTLNALENEGIWIVEDLLNRTEAQLLEIDNLGPKSIQEIHKALDLLGLKQYREEQSRAA